MTSSVLMPIHCSTKGRRARLRASPRARGPCADRNDLEHRRALPRIMPIEMMSAALRRSPISISSPHHPAQDGNGRTGRPDRAGERRNRCPSTALAGGKKMVADIASRHDVHGKGRTFPDMSQSRCCRRGRLPAGIGENRAIRHGADFAMAASSAIVVDWTPAPSESTRKRIGEGERSSPEPGGT